LKDNLIKILKFTGFTALGVLLLYFAFRGIKFDTLIDDFKNLNYYWVILSLVFAVIAYISRAIRWRLIVEPLGYKPSTRNTFYSMMVGYLANFAFPRIGEITRCATLAKKEKIPVDRLIGTVIVERAVDLLTLVILLIILIIFRFETFGSFFQDTVFKPLQEKVVNTLNFSMYIWIAVGIIVITIPVLYLVFRNKLSSVNIIVKVKNIIKGIVEGLKTVYKMEKRWKFIFHSVFIWLNYWVMTWVVVFALPATSNLGIIDGLFLLVIGGLGMSAPVQSGIGAYHWIVSRGLVAVYGTVTLEEGLVFATVSHESQAILAILLGSLSFALIFKKRQRAPKFLKLISNSYNKQESA